MRNFQPAVEKLTAIALVITGLTTGTLVVASVVDAFSDSGKSSAIAAPVRGSGHCYPDARCK